MRWPPTLAVLLGLLPAALAVAPPGRHGQRLLGFYDAGSAASRAVGTLHQLGGGASDWSQDGGSGLERIDATIALAVCTGLWALVACALTFALWTSPAPSTAALAEGADGSNPQDQDGGFSEPAHPGPWESPSAAGAPEAARVRPLSRTRTWALTALNLAYGFTLASQGMVVAPLEAKRLWPERSSVALGALAGLVGVAQLVGPEAGHWSDQWRSRLGRRRPMILIATAWVSSFTFGLWLLSCLYMRYAFVVVFFLQQVGWNVITSVQLGLVPDRVPEASRDFAGGASAANTLLGALAGFVSVEAFSTWHYHTIYGFMVALTGLSCAIVCAAADEEGSLDRPAEKHSQELGWLSRTLEHYSFDFQKHRDFGLLMLTKTLYYAVVVVKGFLLFYCQDLFRLPDPAHERALTARVSITAEMTAAVAAVVVMLVLDAPAGPQPAPGTAPGAPSRWSRTPRSLLSLGAGALWMSLLWLGPIYVGSKVRHGFPNAGEPAARAWASFMVTGTAAWGLGQGAYLAGDQALSFALLPCANDAARTLGLMSVCAFVGSSLGGGVAGGLLAAFGPGGKEGKGYTFVGYSFVFAFAAVLSLMIVAIACKIRVNPKNQPSVESTVS